MLLANVTARENSYEFVDEAHGSLYVVSDLETAEKIRSDYFGNIDLKPFQSLNQAVEASLGKSVIAMSYFEGVVYFSVFGEGTVLLIRNNDTKIILTSGKGAKSASGYPKEGDIMILKTVNGKIALKFENKRSFNFNFPVKFNKKIYLKSQVNDQVSPESKKLTFLVGLILLVILVVGVSLGLVKKRNNDLKNKYQGILNDAKSNLQEAITLATSDPEKSRELFIMSEEDIKKIDELKVTDSSVTELKNKIENSREAILGEYKGNSELFLDLSLLSSGFKGDSISFSGGNIYILDKNGKKVVKAEISTKKSKVVAGPTVIDSATDLASYENDVYIMGSDGIYEIDNGKQKVIDKSWQGEAFIKVFGGNMYVLSKSDNQIYRATGIPQGFSDQKNWLSNSVTANFSEAKYWGIDGAVYVIYPNSKILKYSQGSPQSFKLAGITPEVGNVDSIHADPNNTYLYFLDRAGKRVIVTDKKGSYKAQYLDDKIGDATSLIASEADKKIILLTGEKLLQIEIKHQ